MSDLPDKLLSRSGVRANHPGSAFDRFLATLVPGEPPPDDFNRALLYAALGSALTLASATVLALLPSREAILGAGFFAVGRRTLANVMGIAGDLALPVAVVGVALLLATGAIALVGRRDGLAGTLCIAQPVVGVATLGGAGLGWGVLLAAVALNLVIWVVLVTLIVMAAIAILTGFIAALASG